ncbi:ABC transporter substrate-binding protein [Diaminobutyricibacter sp. McL0618]|uniref:ABC transporter substrate-binding protein n=1 Tax=Leifsonia sp. McL0618 TaxID=3415677 RepID=UPI003CE9E6A8
MKIDRRTLLLGGLAAGVAPLFLSGCAPTGAAASAGSGTLNWLTWSDHFSNDQLAKVAGATKITGRPKLFSDNADALLQLKQTGSQFDMVSADALWVKKYRESGLIDPFQLDEIPASAELYPEARQFPFFTDPQGYLGFPFSWSSVQIYYNPAVVKTPPTSWADITDPKYKGLVVAENIPTDLMAIAGIATGSKSPYGLDTDGISKAANYLKALKPNMVKLATQNSEIVTMLSSGAAAIGISNLGTDLRVKAAGGPQIEAAYPKEGTIGFIDSEMVTSAGKNKALVKKFIGAMETRDYIVQNFKTNGRPLFNQKAAQVLLNDPKWADSAKRLFMDQPEKALAMTLKGPAGDQQAYTEAFNQVFGA